MVLLVGVGVALAVLALRSGDDDGGGDASAESGAGAHDHGMGSALPGCDAGMLAGAMMMFDPSRADELAASTCPWPYDASISSDGGTEDPSLSAPFEPRTYAELFDVVAAQKFGVCQVGRLPDPVEDGFVFGFSLSLRAATCAGGPANVTLDAREYVTKAWRDQQAHSFRGGEVMVLGRWTLTLTGGTDADPTTYAGLRDGLIALGAQVVTEG